jgi:type IV secretion system protein VirB11
MISYVTRSIDVIVHVGKRGVLEVFLPSRYDEQKVSGDDT